MRNGVDPRALETMSLYEIVSMISALEKMTNNRKDVTDEEMQQADEMIRSVTLNDPNVSL